MSQSELLQNSVPNDIALKIASSLQVSDVCSLGSCSRFWRELCGSDCLWAALYRNKWPPADNKENESSSPKVSDVCRFWRETSGSDCLAALYRNRPPADNKENESSSPEAECVMEILWHYKIAERQVCVQWWKMGRWLYGFRLGDESHTRNVSLEDLTMDKEKEILHVLHRGAGYGVLLVRISAAKPTCTSWSFQNGQTQN